MIRRVAILDTETTGLDPAKGRCIEVAVVVYDLQLAAPIQSFSSLIFGAEHNDAFDTNRIPVDALQWAPAADIVWSRVKAIVENAEAFVAHRAEFDSQWVPEPLRSSRPWVCSKFHIAWPDSKYGDGLVHVALAHGVGVVHAHRAMADVDTLARLFSRVAERGASLSEMIAHAMRPRVKVKALVSYDNRDQAKQAGFQWDPEKKTWWREIFEDDMKSFSFFVQAL